MIKIKKNGVFGTATKGQKQVADLQCNTLVSRGVHRNMKGGFPNAKAKFG